MLVRSAPEEKAPPLVVEALTSAAEVNLPRSYELDDAPGFERFEQSIVSGGHLGADDLKKALLNAVKKFTRATELRPGMFEAWNYLGYSQRKLGRYDAALAAYDRALSLKPDYAEALFEPYW